MKETAQLLVASEAGIYMAPIPCTSRWRVCLAAILGTNSDDFVILDAGRFGCCGPRTGGGAIYSCCGVSLSTAEWQY